LRLLCLYRNTLTIAISRLLGPGKLRVLICRGSDFKFSFQLEHLRHAVLVSLKIHVQAPKLGLGFYTELGLLRRLWIFARHLFPLTVANFKVFSWGWNRNSIRGTAYSEGLSLEVIPDSLLKQD